MAAPSPDPHRIPPDGCIFLIVLGGCLALSIFAAVRYLIHLAFS